MSPNAETMGRTFEKPKSNWALVFLARLAAVGTLYLARDIAIPNVLAVLLALLLRPLFSTFAELARPQCPVQLTRTLRATHPGSMNDRNGTNFGQICGRMQLPSGTIVPYFLIPEPMPTP